jgi:hypothetical protein
MSLVTIGLTEAPSRRPPKWRQLRAELRQRSASANCFTFEPKHEPDRQIDMHEPVETQNERRPDIRQRNTRYIALAE